MGKLELRIECLNIPHEAWLKVDALAAGNDFIEVTPQELIDLIGFGGGFFNSAKFNDTERFLVNAYYELGRRLSEK